VTKQIIVFSRHVTHYKIVGLVLSGVVVRSSNKESRISNCYWLAKSHTK